MKKDDRVTIRISTGMRAALDHLAKMWNVTRSAVITDILMAYMYQNGMYKIMKAAEEEGENDGLN